MSAVLPLRPPPTFEPLHLLACENALKAHPNQSAAELSALTGASADDVRDWLQQLSREGRAHIAGFTRCRITGATANTWMPGRDPLLYSDTPPLVLQSEYAQALDAMESPVDPNQIGLFA